MKQLTTTKATYMGVGISVSTDSINGKRMFCCGNDLEGAPAAEKWFATQGEAIANERHEIDRRKGITPTPEDQRWRRRR